MARGLARSLALAASVVASVACKGPVVSSPLTGQTRYLCCNLRYEKPQITDNPYPVGTLIPFGTRVQILEVRTNSVKFQPEGYPEITLIQKYGKRNLPFDQFMARMFLDTNPRDMLARPTPAAAPRGRRRGRAAAAPAAPTPSQLALVEKGVVERGMTKQEVAMSLGYPPANRTPSLDQSAWHYWKNRWNEYTVLFEGDRVAYVID